jgi:hypothetical protein
MMNLGEIPERRRLGSGQCPCNRALFSSEKNELDPLHKEIWGRLAIGGEKALRKRGWVR